MLIYIQAIQNESDRSLVEELYNKYSNTMLYNAQSILKDRYRAEDAVSQAFIKIMDKLQIFSFKNCNKTRGLLGIVVRDICYDMLRDDKSKNIVPIEDYEGILEDGENIPFDYVVSEEGYQFVLDCLYHLNDRFKDILRLKLVFEFTNEEISKILGITPENVRVRIHRARQALIEEMEKRGNGNG